MDNARLITITKKILIFLVQLSIANVILFGALFTYVARIEPNWIEVKEQPVYVSKLPSEFEGLRIVQISDLHGKFFPNKELVSRINRLEPDVVAITGDVFDHSEETPIEYAKMVLEGLAAKHGVYFVLGNNDTYLQEKAIKETMAQMNIVTLINETANLKIEDNSIHLVGVHDPYSQKADLSKALKGLGSQPKILLAHTPEIIYEAAKNGIDLVLVGHTHGGQIMVPFVPRFITNVSKGYEQFIAGLYKVEETQMYVNRGLGENDIHMRLLARPEITVITLHGE